MSPLSYVLTIAITTLLVGGLTIGAADLLTSQREDATREELRTVGNRIAGELVRIDELTSRGGSVSVATTQPARITGDTYSVRLIHDPGGTCDRTRFESETCLRLSAGDESVTTFVPVRNESAISIAPDGPGRFSLSASAPGATADRRTLASQDLSSRVGVGEGVAHTGGPLATGVGNRPPVAAFEFSPSSPWTGQSVSFDASDSFDPDGSIVAYRWDWDGDGTVDEVTTTPTTSHTFSAGSYSVDLQVMDGEDATSNVSRFLGVTGLVYEGDMSTIHTGQTVSFTLRNELGRDVDITHVMVDPTDDNRDRLHSTGDEVRIDTPPGSDDGALDHDNVELYDDGRILDLADDAELPDGGTATVDLGRFNGNMDGEEVRVAVKYEVGERTNSTVFTDVAGGAAVTNYGLTSSGQDVDLSFESSEDLDRDTIAVALGGERSGTLDDASDFTETATGSSFTYTADVSTGSDGVFEANLTAAETEAGVTATGLPMNDSTVVSTGTGYVWTTAAHWDGASSQDGIVHADVGDRDADRLSLGYPTEDRGGSSLVAYYPLDDPTVAPDESTAGDDNDGTVAGGPGESVGIFGTSGYDLDGDDDHVRIPDSDSLDASDEDEVTVSAWVNKDAAQSGWIAVFQHSDRSYNLQFASGNEPEFTIYDDSWVSAGDSSAENDVWHHLVGVYDGDETKLYVDGRLVDVSDDADEIDGAGTDAGLGTNLDTGGRHLDGQIDEVRVYDRALDDGEVEALYDAATSTGTLTTGWQSVPSEPIDGDDVAVRYEADVAPGEDVEVRVTGEFPGGRQTSDWVALGDGAGDVAVTGLPDEQSHEYRVEVRMESSTVTGSPTVDKLEVVADS